MNHDPLSELFPRLESDREFLSYRRLWAIFSSLSTWPATSNYQLVSSYYAKDRTTANPQRYWEIPQGSRAVIRAIYYQIYGLRPRRRARDNAEESRVLLVTTDVTPQENVHFFPWAGSFPEQRYIDFERDDLQMMEMFRPGISGFANVPGGGPLSPAAPQWYGPLVIPGGKKFFLVHFIPWPASGTDVTGAGRFYTWGVIDGWIEIDD